MDNWHVSPPVSLNLNVRGMPMSATVALNERSNELRASGRTIYKLGLGQSPFPVPESVVQALRDNAHQKDYLPVRGLLPLREAVARQYQRQFGIGCHADQVLVGPGSKELMFILQLVYYGDLVVPTPAWVSYAPQAAIIGRHIRLLHTRRQDDWRVTPELLDRLCHRDKGRPRLLVLNYPSNPTGASYNGDELAALAETAREHRVVLLSDEIYGRLHHRDEHVSLVPLYPEGTIYSGGLSKWAGAGGWRLGLFVVPRCMKWLLDAMATVASETFTSTSAPIQYAAVAAFADDPSIERYVLDSQRVLRALGRHLADMVQRAGALVTRPAGAFYLFPDFSPFAEQLAARGISTSSALCTRLLEETGVAVLPGSEFGRPDEELTLRLAYVNFDGAAALAAARSTAEGELDQAFLRQHCAETLLAVERMLDWITAG